MLQYLQFQTHSLMPQTIDADGPTFACLPEPTFCALTHCGLGAVTQYGLWI